MKLNENDSNSPRQKRSTWRIGLKERMRMQQTVIVIICFLLYLALKPVVMGMIQNRNFQVCQNNVRKIAQGIKNYAGDWDDTLPNANDWQDAAESDITATTGTGFSVETYFHCPLDHTHDKCSYAYNSMLGGLSMNVRPGDLGRRKRLEEIGRLSDAPLVIEKYGGGYNQSVNLKNWDDVTKNLTKMHKVPEPTGSVIMGDLKATYRNEDELTDLEGRRF